ncbi:hypothetical protein [Brevibacterium sp. SMBL_HHYL_HB1]|uniref:hypothetical protein n=1 Tax=Brevibacterium sp. SMBL_HHYL_HB1 TaxID=2777556 RepID=UPI001BA6DDDD|nr:hypothetical protein [Brevibacterium sp. SMBL_HHYL_HB1]QUL80634.1 hypothetical protein IG171_07715 [Brevibacterium sp. SMBL_HHYL_HB1]
MSTKIYDAYRLPVGTDPFEVVAPLRAAILPARLRADAQVLARTACQLADDYSLHGDRSRMPVRRRDGSRLYTPQNPWVSAIRVLADQEADLSPSDTFHDAHRFSVSLLRDPADGRLLAKAFLGHSDEIREAFEAFCATQGWADWHYQDQTDWPEEVSELEWAQRRDSWDRTVGDSGVIADRCLNIDVRPSGFSTSPSVLGIGDDEEDAINAVTVSTPQVRLSRMLLAVQKIADGEFSITDLLSASERIKNAVNEGSDGTAELLELMSSPSVDELQGRQSGGFDDGIRTHSISEETLAAVAARLT